MRRRFLQVLPPTWLVAAFAGLYLFFELSWQLERLSGASVPRDEVTRQGGLVLFACASYGLHRAVNFHPVWLDGYFRWLKTTPWTSRMPLPLGPIHLVWVDVVVLAVLETLLLRDPAVFWFAGPVVFLAVYLAVSVVGLMNTGQVRIGWALLFGIGLALVTLNAAVAVAILLALYGIAFVGLRRSLEAFPWSLERGLLQVNVGGDPKSRSSVGWPYEGLRPCELKPAIGTQTGVLLGLLSAWYVFVGGIVLPRAYVPVLQLFGGMVLVLVPAVRLGIYVLGYASPISVLGRLFTGRLIIPGYDKVMVAPLLVSLGGIGLWRALDWSEVTRAVSMPLAVGVCVTLAANLGPTLAEWRLTGTHRLTTGTLIRPTGGRA